MSAHEELRNQACAETRDAVRALADRALGQDVIEELDRTAQALAALNDLDAKYWSAFKRLCHDLSRCNTLDDIDDFRQAIEVGRAFHA